MTRRAAPRLLRLPRPPRSLARLLAASCLALATAAAHAVLGGRAPAIAADSNRLAGTRRIEPAAANADVQVHVIVLADGSQVREFVGPAGIVFAVAWSTRFKPRLETLLGTYATTYADAAARSARGPGVRHAMTIAGDDLVVHAAAHLNAHVGLAYAPSLVPAGVRIDDLR